MISLEIINGTIAEWEAKEPTFYTIERLAWLYIVRDQILLERNRQEVRQDPAQQITVPEMPAVRISTGSEFMEAAAAADPETIWPILDELMDILKQLQPRLYDSVLRRLKE